jgi:MFS family permease
MRKFGTIFGAMASLIAGGSGLGPVLGGWIHDTWDTYVPLVWAGSLFPCSVRCCCLV